MATKVKKKRIRINEGQYMNMFCPSLLMEAKKLSDILKIGAFSDIDEGTMMQIASLDPTYKGGEYAGKYTLWLVDQYKKGYDVFNMEGLKDAISKFNANKTKLSKSKITDYNPEELINAVNNIYDDGVGEAQGGLCKSLPSAEQLLAMPDSSMIVTLYDDGIISAKCPLTWEASRKLGGSTSWCTASSNESSFHRYLSNGFILIIYSKGGRPMFQEAFDADRTVEFNNEENDNAETYEFEECMGVDINFIPRTLKHKVRNLILPVYNELLERYFSNIDINNNSFIDDGPLSEEGYSDIPDNFHLIRDSKVGKLNILDSRDNTLLFGFWLDGVEFISNGIVVNKDKKDNLLEFVDGKPRLWFDEWLDLIYGYGKILRVISGGKETILDSKTKNNLIGKWVDKISFHNGHVILRLGKECSICSLEEISDWSDNWYDDIIVVEPSKRYKKNVDPRDLLISARIGNKYVLVDLNGYPIEDELKPYYAIDMDIFGNKIVQFGNPHMYNLLLHGADSLYLDEWCRNIDMFTTKKSSAVLIKYGEKVDGNWYGEVFLLGSGVAKMIYPGANHAFQYNHWLLIRDCKTFKRSIYDIDTGNWWKTAGYFDSAIFHPNMPGVSLERKGPRGEVYKYTLIDDAIKEKRNDMYYP